MPGTVHTVGELIAELSAMPRGADVSVVVNGRDAPVVAVYVLDSEGQLVVVEGEDVED